MTKAVTVALALGLALFAFATTGIASLGGELEAVTPQRSVPAPATEQVIVESRRVDCPLEERTPERRKL